MNVMKIHRFLILCACLALGLPATHATTVIPPTFDQLVNQAQLIFQGTVTDLRPQWMGEGAERHIVTFVTFKIDDVIKGTLSETYTIRMFGGTLDGQTIEVTDAPIFKVGDRDILFVENNGTQFVPLVGIMHGRFRIQTATSGREKVAKDNGAAVSDPAKLGVDEKAAVTGPALSTAEFKAAVRQKLGQNAAK
jgi:hypothetical protein